MEMRSEQGAGFDGRALAALRWGSRSRAVDRALDALADRADLIEPDQAERLRKLAEKHTQGTTMEEKR